MKCGRIRRWILRNGGNELPARWQDHVAECDKCRTLLAQVRALDGALGDGEVPDPGEAYWNAFAPGVARRIDEVSQGRRPAPVTGRPSWLKIWVPALGAAALALLIARELVVNPTPRPVMERDVPVVSQQSASPAIQPQEERHPSPEMAITATPADNGPAYRRQDTQPEDNEAEKLNDEVARSGERSAEHAQLSASNATDRAAIGDALNASPAGSDAAETATEPSAEDARVWPDRRVTKMGEVDSDQTRQTLDAEGRLSEQGTPTLAENTFGLTAAGAETSATMPTMGRLEAPRTYRASPALDTQSPMDAMRRFDELRELRSQISTLSAITPAERTPEQNRELCASWYRMGTITDNALVLDSAIQQLGHCLETLNVPDSDEWQTKSEKLTERRALFNQE